MSRLLVDDLAGRQSRPRLDIQAAFQFRRCFCPMLLKKQSLAMTKDIGFVADRIHESSPEIVFKDFLAGPVEDGRSF